MRNIPFAIVVIGIIFLICLVIFIRQTRARAHARAALPHDGTSEENAIDEKNQLISAPLLIMLLVSGGCIAIFVIHLLVSAYG